MQQGVSSRGSAGAVTIYDMQKYILHHRLVLKSGPPGTIQPLKIKQKHQTHVLQNLTMSNFDTKRWVEMTFPA